ncbi:MAG: hypothetical protein LUP91_13355, partial [Methylococcaceae bacterium]|nr:hypothetical protein [Methylococcaceae bacterium]
MAFSIKVEPVYSASSTLNADFGTIGCQERRAGCYAGTGRLGHQAIAGKTTGSTGKLFIKHSFQYKL